jgi:hypothetical protein
VSDIDALLEALKKTPPMFPGTPWGDERLSEFEAQTGVRLPADLVAVLRAHGECGIPRFTLDLAIHGDHELGSHLKPGMLIIGDDGGGSIYVCDTAGASGRGAGTVLLMEMGVMLLAEARVVAPSMAQAMLRALRKENLFEGSPKLGA